MQKITLIDATLREHTSGPSFKEELDIAYALDKLHVDFIEVAPLLHPATDRLFLHNIAPLLTFAGVSVPVPPAEDAIRAAWDAVKGCARPRLNLQVPVSTVQMEYLFHKKAPAMLETLAAAGKLCASLDPAFEVSLLDATRAEPDVLRAAADAAAAAGASQLTLCDSAGILLPAEFAAFAAKVRADLPETVALAVECSDALGTATAAAFAALSAGVSVLKVAAATPALPPLAAVGRVLRQKSESLGVSFSLDLTLLEHASARIARAVGENAAPAEADSDGRALPDRSASGGAGALSAPVSLDAAATPAATAAALDSLGYSLSPENVHHVHEEVLRIAARKTVEAKDLDAIVAAVAQVPATYTLSSFVITCGNTISTMATVVLSKDGRELTGSSLGNGPVDAAILAIEQIVGRHFELEDWRMQSVTEGRTAVGKSLVKLRAGSSFYSGQGVSTDIVGASIRAYLDAVNKICFEESAR